MSLDLQKQVWDDEEVKGPAKTVLLHLAWYVSKEAWDRGGKLLSWPSQNTLATKCGIARATVETALKRLDEQGKIRDTGQRKQRRTVVWELYPSAAPDVPYGWEVAADLPESQASDLPGSEASQADMPSTRASGSVASLDLPSSRHDLPNPSAELPGSEASTCPGAGDKREGTGENNGEGIEREGARGARDIYSPADSTQELAEVESLLASHPTSKLLTRRRDELRESLGAAA